MKRCRRCGEEKPLDAFARCSTGVLGRHPYCRLCGREYKRAWTEENRARRRAQDNAWADRNRERVRANARAIYQRGYAKDPEPFLRRTRRWAIENPERSAVMRVARTAVRTAIRRGGLVRPSVCAHCGAVGVPIEAAHRDYDRPLDVVWLCRQCHRRWDRAQPKSLGFDRAISAGAQP